MVRKCRALAEIAVVEVAGRMGVKTRARALALAASTSATATTTMMTQRRTVAKRRKLNEDCEDGLKVSASSYIQLRSRRILVQHSVDHRYLSPCSDHDVSCWSSNGSSDRIELADLEVESVEVETSTYSSCSERKEAWPFDIQVQAESNDLDSTSKPSEADSRRRSSAEKMPTESEIEEFFSAAEKNLQKQFTEKYNYDIVKDEPVEGRYEWVRLKP